MLNILRLKSLVYIRIVLLIDVYLKQRLDFGVQSPPLPISQFQIGGAISLKNADGIELLRSLHIIPKEKLFNEFFCKLCDVQNYIKAVVLLASSLPSG